MIDPKDITQLEKIQLELANRGLHGIVGIIRDILYYLYHGDIQSAVILRCNEGDKTRIYPELENLLCKILGCRLHSNHNCIQPFCKN